MTLSSSAIATDVLTALAERRQLRPFSDDGLTLERAYAITPLLRAAFEARGDAVRGRKIGFTNRGIWQQYGVYAPIWGYVTDKTLHDLTAGASTRAADFCEPRIEPEIMFGLQNAPHAAMDDAALGACIGWIALGYEIVQSHYPGWIFKPADTVATNALHGALFVGPRHPYAPRAAAWQRELATFTATLHCNDVAIDTGGGALVLDSPLKALRHLVTMLASDPYNPPLAPGEVVSTGTLTKAMPVKAGETWTVTVAGIALDAVSLQIA